MLQVARDREKDYAETVEYKVWQLKAIQCGRKLMRWTVILIDLAASRVVGTRWP